MNLNRAFRIIMGDIFLAREFSKAFRNLVTITGPRPGEILTFNSLDAFDRTGEIAFLSNLSGLRKFYWNPRHKDHMMNAVVTGVKTNILSSSSRGDRPRIHIEVDHRLTRRPNL